VDVRLDRCMQKKYINQWFPVWFLSVSHRIRQVMLKEADANGDR
jgi:hypothetical protein